MNEDRVLALYYILRLCLTLLLLLLGGCAFAQFVDDGHSPTVRGGLTAIAAALALTGAGALLTAVLRERQGR